MDHLQIAINGDNGQVDHGAIRPPPENVFTAYGDAEPIAEYSGEVDIAEPHRVGDDQKEAAEKIENVLVDNQHELLVLFRGHQSVEDEGVACRSHDADKYYSPSPI